MKKIKQTEQLAKKAILRFLKEIEAETDGEAMLAINKLVAVSSSVMQEVSGHEAAIDMLESIKVNTQTLLHVKSMPITDVSNRYIHTHISIQ